MEIKSKIYLGKVRHRRFAPKRRDFTHSVCYFYLDLSEIETLFNRPWIFSAHPFSVFGFRRRAYLGPTDLSLDEAVRRKVENSLGFRPDGPIRVLSQIAYLEFAFNPVSFYYCFDRPGEKLTAIVAEITNTPWNERHSYVLKCESSDRETFTFKKDFHVSPFLPMEMSYLWKFSLPRNHLTVHMENRDALLGAETAPLFDTTLTLEAHSWSPRALRRALLMQPLMTFKTLLLIYGHAGILWLKKTKVFTHPAKLNRTPPRTPHGGI